MSVRVLSIFLALQFAAFSFAAAPSSEQLHQLYDQRKDTELLKAIREVLVLKDQSGYDRYDLLCLRGEALLRTKADASAADAFRDAAKAAKTDEQASLARATEYLLRRSRNQSYTPKPRDKKAISEKVEPIALVDADSRKKAFAALLSDVLVEKSREIDSARRATSLDPILSIAPTIGVFRDVERASGATPDQTPQIMAELGGNARGLMKNAEQTMASRIDALDREANTTEAICNGDCTSASNYTYYKQGLSTPQVQELGDIANTCRQIGDASAKLNKLFGKDGGSFSETVSNANTAQKRALALIQQHAPKTGTYASPRPK